MEQKGFVTALGKRIHYKWQNLEWLDGENPILLFLHDGLGSISQWKNFPKELSDTTQLPALIYDRYGYGKSDGLAEPRQNDYLHKESFEFLPEILNQLNISNPLILIGHSDGGSIALLFASRFVEQTKAVITEAAHVFVEEEMRIGIRKTVKAYQKSNLKELLAKHHGKNTESIFHAWADIWLSDSFVTWNIEEYLPKITAPLLLIQGRNDEYGHLHQPEIIAKQVKGKSEIFRVENCGHIPHHQQREKVLKKVKGFISEKVY